MTITEGTAAGIGPLLAEALRIQTGDRQMSLSHGWIPTSRDPAAVPVLMRAARLGPSAGEPWSHYRARATEYLTAIAEPLESLDVPVQMLIAANALRAYLNPEQIEYVEHRSQGLQLMELDALLQMTRLDDVPGDIGLEEFHQSSGGLDGKGVRVAVLDSGVDREHPTLRLADSVSVCGESSHVCGEHGTHVAGCIGSQDEVFRGIAPGVDLINVKVLRASGVGSVSSVALGVDAALDRKADILSLSLGANHLPTWSDGGHGWSCDDGACEMCTAVNNAVQLDAAVVVVAAGNDHGRAEALRNTGHGDQIPTELGCPAQAELAITVGAVSKATHKLAPFSSRGPTADGRPKPDIAAPGVNITSTMPIPRTQVGGVSQVNPRALSFGRMSGTSMATPIVAAVAALLIQRRRDAGEDAEPSTIRQDILRAAQDLGLHETSAGAGLLRLP